LTTRVLCQREESLHVLLYQREESLHPRAVVSKRRVLAPTCCCIKEKSPCTLYQREESLHPRAVVSKRRVLAPCIKEKSHCTHAISMFSGSTFCPQANVLAGLDRQRVASVALAPLQLSPQKERRVRGVGDVDGCHGWRRYATRHCVAQLCACVCVRVCVVVVVVEVGGGGSEFCESLSAEYHQYCALLLHATSTFTRSELKIACSYTPRSETTALPRRHRCLRNRSLLPSSRSRSSLLSTEVHRRSATIVRSGQSDVKRLVASTPSPH
jgi:hypothetical protein